MKPYYEHAGISIFLGNAIDVLRDLPEKFINCCVTSPPYWGLRDYKTGKWEGGEAECDHRKPSRFDYKLNPGLGPTGVQDQASNAGSGSVIQYSDICEKCGAVRIDQQIGLERTPDEYVAKIVAVFREVRRVLRDDGTLWLNIGDSYAASPGQRKTTDAAGPKQLTNFGAQGTPSRSVDGLKPKDIVGIPWMLAFALRADGWWLRQDIIWSKPNPMPESVTDRCTKAHEYMFLLTKSARYYFNQEAILEPVSPNTNPRISQDLIHQIGSERAHAGGKTNGNMKAVGRKMEAVGSGNRNNPSFTSAVCMPVTKRNKRSVWEIGAEPFPDAHFATFPTELVKPCILAGCPAGGTALDPFGGSMTTMLVARDLHCKGVAIELNLEYIEIGIQRLPQDVFDFRSAETS